jgi:4-hydroxy-3-polyprenylbenzoate decarboxylase
MHPLNDLRAFMDLLEKRGQLVRVRAQVSQDLEIAAIADHVTKQQGPALLFENVSGYKVPVLINAFGTAQRMAWALGCEDLNALGDRLRKVLGRAQGAFPATLLEKVEALKDLADMARWGPKTVTRAPVQEVVWEGEEADLGRLPVLKCWPLDAGRFITFPLVISRSALGRRNVGLYRMQVFDARTAGMHWQLHKGGRTHWRDAQGRMPVAAVLGGDPATMYSASAPLPPDVDELLFAGFLRGQAVELVRCKTIDLEVPAQAEYVLEGYVDPEETRVEGPFGDHTGYYSHAEPYPVFHLTAITSRRDPVYPTILVGRPLQEDFFLGKATERLFLPLIQMVVPELVDMDMPPHGVFHNLVLVSIRKAYPGQAQKVMYALWGMGLMMLAKCIVVLDADVNVHDPLEVTWRVTNNVDPRRDFTIVDGPLDALDHSGPRHAFGGKVGIDATRKDARDGFERAWPPDIVMDAEVVARLRQRWEELGIPVAPPPVPEVAG